MLKEGVGGVENYCNICKEQPNNRLIEDQCSAILKGDKEKNTVFTKLKKHCA